MQGTNSSAKVVYRSAREARLVNCYIQTLRRKDIYYAIREKTRSIADQHANLGRTVDGSIVQHLQKLRTEIKAHIKASSTEMFQHWGIR